MSRARKILDKLLDEAAGIRSIKKKVRECLGGAGSAAIRGLNEVGIECVEKMLDEQDLESPNGATKKDRVQLNEAKKCMKEAVLKLKKVKDVDAGMATQDRIVKEKK